jgi:CRISPR-associated protein Cmr6
MRNSRRKDLSSITHEQAQHAGLWLDRYIRTQEREAKESRHDFVNEVAHIHESPLYSSLYQSFYQRWCAALAQADPVPLVAKARVDGRMIVGLGTESVLETAISLHRTYGVPYIPGSALKGLAASFARQRLGSDWHPDGTAYQTVFGDTTNAGYVSFFDALYVPGSGHNGAALWPDVITVHHEGYYQDGTEPPADWDSPTPVPFLSATGSYLIAVSGPPDQNNGNGWAEAAMDLLRLALKEMGVGAKTSSGYGRLTLDEHHRKQSGADDKKSITYEKPIEQSSPIDPRQQTEDAIKPWLRQNVQMQLVRVIEGKGYVVRPAPGLALKIPGFMPLELAHGREPQTGNNMSCIVLGVIEVDSTWYAQVKWSPKKKRES